jgi:hypothetical protein
VEDRAADEIRVAGQIGGAHGHADMFVDESRGRLSPTSAFAAFFD